MQGNILFDISHLRFEGSGTADFNAGMALMSNIDSKRNEFYTERFTKTFGQNACRYAPGSVFAYSSVDMRGMDGKLHEEVRIQFEELMNERIQLIETFLTFLWFVKDNSVGLWSTIGQIPSNGIVNHLANNLSSYNCMGEKNSCVFTPEQITEAGALTVKYEKMCPGLITPMREKIMSYELDQHNNPFRTFIQTQKSIINYNSQNSIQRAIHFIVLARKQNVLIYKIAYYMAVFESLLTTDSREITTKMSYRAAFYIAESPQECKEIFRLIGRAYDVRSKFLHGQRFSDDSDFSEKNLLKYATKLDEYLRRIFKNIFDRDHELFTEDESLGSNREAFLNSLVFDTPFRKSKIPKNK
ncbi:MAG: hypothetical protein V4649_18680 [Bacteroidota bacterium]